MPETTMTRVVLPADANEEKPGAKAEAIARTDVPPGYPFDPDQPVPTASPFFQSSDRISIAACLRKNELINPSRIPLSEEDIDFVIEHARESMVALDAVMDVHCRNGSDWTNALIASGAYLEGRFETEGEAKAAASKVYPRTPDGKRFTRIVKTMNFVSDGQSQYWRIAMIDPFTHLHVYQSYAEVIRQSLVMCDELREGLRILEQQR